MPNLYEINADITRLWEKAIDPETGEVDPGVYEQIEQLELDKATKVENIALWIKNLKSDAEAIKAEAKNLTERAKAAEKRAASLQEYVRQALDGEKFQTPRVSISYRTTSSVEVIDIGKVPPEFLRLADPEVNKTAVKAAFKEGREIPGCGLVANTSMVIK